MSNDINSESPKIRDFLLSKNLILSDTITQNGLYASAVGLGRTTSIQTFPVAVQPSENIEESSEINRDELLSKNPYSSTEDLTLTNISTTNFNGNVPVGTPSIEYGNYVGSRTEDSLFNNTSNDIRKEITLRNKYISEEDMVSATIFDNKFSYTQVDGSYLDENGNLNIGGPSTESLDVIGSVLSGKGFGLDSNGLDPQFDIRNSLTGRVLQSTGAIEDTPLGVIGSQQLLSIMGKKGVFNTQKELHKHINTDAIGLLKGEPLLKDNYKITVSSSLGGKILDTALDITGFEVPKSKIDDGGSIFSMDKGFIKDDIKTNLLFANVHTPSSGSILRNEVLIKNTGKGQYSRLFELINLNKFKPNYDIGKGDKAGVQDPDMYPYHSSLMSDIEYRFDDGLGIDERTIWEKDFSPFQEKGISYDSLLTKTKLMFNNNKDLVGALFNEQGTEFLGHSKIETPSGGRISKGSGVLSEDYLLNKGSENVFCRTWTSGKRYDSISDLQKDRELIRYSDKVRNNTENSVLDNNGFVKISPYTVDGKNVDTSDVKRYMFSIENLAWNDNLENLPRIEQGPGDLTTGTKGRIMWFPPYNIKFTDTSTANWDTTTFIGRGEPIYTYNNTERTGSLNFDIIIDYPDYLNNNQIDTDEKIASLAAGCSQYDSLLSIQERDAIITENLVTRRKKSRVGDKGVFKTLNIFFENDSDEVDSNYEFSGSTNLATATTYGLNKPWTDLGKIDELKEKLNTTHRAYDIIITGHASKDGIENYTSEENDKYNLDLSKRRAESVKAWVLANLDDKTDPDFKKRIKGLKYNGDKYSSGIINQHESLKTKRDRFASIEFVYNPTLDAQINDSVDATIEKSENIRDIGRSIKSRFHNEGQYFKKLIKSDSNSDKFIYKSIREKIGFFQPAFHSITPEGFNSRLTFLQQCTRQGPTNNSVKADNLAFGTPPVCILRIGDFYHTKIIIDSVSFDYEPLVWDLNPEGVGVQPMIAKVNMTFKFIGGNSLTGPISKLQNAVSFNYFANTEVYDTRADSLKARDMKADEEIGYEIKEGTKTLFNDMYEVKPIRREVKPLSLINTTPIQPLINEKELEKITEASDANDKLMQSYLRLSSSSYDSGSIDITVRYSISKGQRFNLLEEAVGKVYLLSDSNLNLQIPIGQVKMTPNSENDFNFTNINNEGGLISSSNLTQTVTLSNLSLSAMDLITTGVDGPINDIIYIKLTWPKGGSSVIQF